jgi:hypothetical protein
MKKLLLALAALLASVAFVPAAHADDCDPDDGAAEFARCLAKRSLNRLRQAPTPRLPSRLSKLCDADDDEDDCPRSARIPAVRQPLPPTPRSRAEMPTTRHKQSAAPEPKSRAAATPPDATVGPATAAAASEAPVCTRYLPNLGKTIVIPCSE